MNLIFDYNFKKYILISSVFFNITMKYYVLDFVFYSIYEIKLSNFREIKLTPVSRLKVHRF